jgi:hypothetical protein
MNRYLYFVARFPRGTPKLCDPQGLYETAQEAHDACTGPDFGYVPVPIGRQESPMPFVPTIDRAAWPICPCCGEPYPFIPSREQWPGQTAAHPAPRPEPVTQ